MAGMGCVLMDDFADALLLAKAGHPELAGWWGKLLGGGGGGSIDDGGDKPFDQLTWDQVIASTKTGKYQTFSVGDMCPMELGDFGTAHMQIAGIDKDVRADESGSAHLSLIIHECFGTMASGDNTFWPACDLHQYLYTTVLPLLPKVVRDHLIPVKKYTTTYQSGTRVANFESTETIWAPSSREMQTTSNAETLGVTYSELFPDADSKIKTRIPGGGTYGWLLRTGWSANQHRTVTAKGVDGEATAGKNYRVVFGFCL